MLAFNGRQVKEFEIWITTLGSEVYSTDLNETWNGDVNGGLIAPNGVYHWLIKATGFDTDAQEFGVHSLDEITTYDFYRSERLSAWSICCSDLTLFDVGLHYVIR